MTKFELKEKMRLLKIFEKDIKESFIHASGPGGQNVNKVATCVYLKHLPTKIEVKYQRERSQSLNRFKARCLLVNKIENKKKEEERKRRHQREKKRRQKRKMSMASKEKMLQGKKRKSERKKLRKKVSLNKIDHY